MLLESFTGERMGAPPPSRASIRSTEISSLLFLMSQSVTIIGIDPGSRNTGWGVVREVSGVLILEALAQTGAVAALSLPENKGKLALFGGIKNARFRKQVTPGDVLTLHCELVEQRGPVGVGKASAYVDGKCAATAELTFVLTEAPPKMKRINI